MPNFIYLDNAATARPCPEAVRAACGVLENCYGNPSSLHGFGLKAENIISDARRIIAETVGAGRNEIYFAPSGTVANNTAVLGFLRRNPRAGKKVFLSSVEHPSVYNIFRELDKSGYEVLEIPINGYHLDCDFLESNIDENTALISVMAVNNETGAIFDITKIREIVNKKRLKTVIHSDCVQAYMKLHVNVNNFGADLITASAHKIGGPKGAGFLYVRRGLNIEPVFFGGGQEKNLFSGTENVAAIAGFAKAAEIFDNSGVNELKEIFLAGLKPGIKVNGAQSPAEVFIPNIINISFGIRSEINLHILESKGIFVSSGSACSQKKGDKNRVLKNFGLSAREQDTAIRVSISPYNTKEEIKAAVNEINKIAD